MATEKTITLTLTLDELERLDDAIINKNCSYHDRIRKFNEDDFWYCEWRENSKIWEKIYDAKQELTEK